MLLNNNTGAVRPMISIHPKRLVRTKNEFANKNERELDCERPGTTRNTELSIQHPTPRALLRNCARTGVKLLLFYGRVLDAFSQAALSEGPSSPLAGTIDHRCNRSQVQRYRTNGSRCRKSDTGHGQECGYSVIQPYSDRHLQPSARATSAGYRRRAAAAAAAAAEAASHSSKKT